MRTSNWPTALAKFIESRRHIPFNWRSNNCGFLVADWILILTGVDPVAEWRNLTPREFVRFIRGNKVTDLADTGTANYGWPQCPVAHAQRGDMLECTTERGPTLGVCNGATVAFPGKAGLIFHPVSQCSRAWRIN